MAKHSIDTIAEVLIDKIQDMERTASKIEAASKRELQVNTTELKRLVLEQSAIIGELNASKEAILSDFKRLKENNQSRVPNWILGVLTGIVFLSFGFIYYAWNKSEAYDLDKQKAEYFEQKYNELKSEK